MRRAISRVGRIRTLGKTFELSIGLWPNAKARLPRAICSDEREPFDAVPFFWSQHYDVPINYVGHAEKWDEITVHGDIGARDCLLQYKSKGRVLAVASIYRDLENLRAEFEMERKGAG